MTLLSDALVIFLVLAAILAFGATFVFPARAKLIKIIGSIVGVVLLISVILVQNYSAERARSTLRSTLLERLGRIQNPYEVIINGKTPSNPEAVVAALRNVADREAHHSTPTKRFVITVESKGETTTIYLWRDSNYTTEYWVYWPDDSAWGNSPTGEEIGRINTPVLNGL